MLGGVFWGLIGICARLGDLRLGRGHVPSSPPSSTSTAVPPLSLQTEAARLIPT